ncbi:uncharacterized protein LOC134238447 [Saccostrea cucullata]|uniref:uncharacterized protein LOC134238447 n=1 Tax=Saccostrea cuccullata TaxID=36930 RepID=UPI002ED058C6
MVWLLRVGWDPPRLKLYKQDNGYKLYTSSHVDNVKLHYFENVACFYIKCQTVPETRQQAAPYQTWILVSEGGQIQSGGCSCVANDGSCKHCTALLFSLCSFNERHKDRHTLVRTDVLCSWDKPRSASRPEKIQNVQVHNSNSAAENVQHGPCHTVYNPCKGLQNEREIEKKLFDMCKDSNSLLLETLDPPSDYEDTSEDIPGLHEVVKEASLKNISVTSHLQALFDPETILRIADITKDQSTGICDEWKRHRHGRITASVFSKVLHFRGSKSHENYIVREIMQLGSDISNVPAVAYGRENEAVARQLYFDEYKKGHKCAKLNNIGFHIFTEKPYMGATPDGLIMCKCCGKGLIEIKCSYSHQNETPYDIAGDSSYHLYRDESNGSVYLRPDSPWYIQIQGQLGILSLPWCDFVFYTKRGLLTDRIYFDCDVFNSIVQKCTLFFEKYLCNALLSQ